MTNRRFTGSLGSPGGVDVFRFSDEGLLISPMRLSAREQAGGGQKGPNAAP